MNNRWNERIYKLWSPIYDHFFNTGPFLRARKQVFQDVNFDDKNLRILFVGVGTGADLELINYRELNITAIDYSDEMLDKAREKFKDSPIQFIKMDAQNLDLSDQQFDLVVASLVLSVVPDPNQCLKEMIRVLKKGGEMIIFDKFTPKGKDLTPLKKIIRPIIRLLGTDIGLNFESLYENHKGTIFVKEDIPLIFDGMYRKILVTK
jgi:phosphatidylethanolamine/phosphatidyl-N-methylethanolamine N-methyltransferase